MKRFALFFLLSFFCFGSSADASFIIDDFSSGSLGPTGSGIIPGGTRTITSSPGSTVAHAGGQFSLFTTTPGDMFSFTYTFGGVRLWT